MHSLNNTVFESNKYLKINFARGALSSNAVLLLVKEFVCKLGFDKILKSGIDYGASTQGVCELPCLCLYS
ncbi:MAG: hypothetical protein HDR23_10190 [Lachnospiraceae bacterium]|nr:hypothetical protein [Lachnospiraceae bacterium]